MMSTNPEEEVVGGEDWRSRAHAIIFEAETPSGRMFDVLLIWAIMLSVFAVMLDSVEEVAVQWGGALRAAEWVFTVLFTVEYGLRIACVRRPSRYIFSFYGVIDLLAILPTYVGVLFPQTHFFLVIRALRLLRVFRVLKLARYVEASGLLLRALRASRVKILVFMYFVITLVVVIGAVMYVVEGAENGFTSIPRSVYWAIVTLTTVGYGDISPQTALGQMLASLVMILGYGIIAVPTGIVTAELSRDVTREVSTVACPSCSLEGHAPDATYCKHCGSKL